MLVIIVPLGTQIHSPPPSVSTRTCSHSHVHANTQGRVQTPARGARLASDPGLLLRLAEKPSGARVPSFSLRSC